MFKKSEVPAIRTEKDLSVGKRSQVEKITSFLRGDQTRYEDIWNGLPLNDDPSKIQVGIRALIHPKSDPSQAN